MNLPAPVLYGLSVFGCVFAVGWITGMGGDFLPNLIFAALMGVISATLFALIKRYVKGRDK